MVWRLAWDDEQVLPESPLPPAIRCECVARPLGSAREFQLGWYPATSPRLALRWLFARTQDVADQLDPAFARPARHWLADRDEHRRAMSALARGGSYGLAFGDGIARYALSAGRPHPDPARGEPSASRSPASTSGSAPQYTTPSR